MKKITLALVIIFIILFIWVVRKRRYDLNNTVEIYSKSDGYKYRVHKAHGNHELAANKLAEINKRVSKLIKHLEIKYPAVQQIKEVDREKNNHIDVIPITSDASISHERARLLIERYDPDHIIENSPLNADNYTAYTENKGEIIAICLRSKEDVDELHDINLITFVVLHELAHIANKTIGHDEQFWKTFRWLLEEATEIGIYQPINYTKTPKRYCGLWIDYNPLWDSTITV